jgi:hypothetical protein
MKMLLLVSSTSNRVINRVINCGHEQRRACTQCNMKVRSTKNRHTTQQQQPERWSTHHVQRCDTWTRARAWNAAARPASCTQKCYKAAARHVQSLEHTAHIWSGLHNKCAGGLLHLQTAQAIGLLLSHFRFVAVRWVQSTVARVQHFYTIGHDDEEDMCVLGRAQQQDVLECSWFLELASLCTCRHDGEQLLTFPTGPRNQYRTDCLL